MIMVLCGFILTEPNWGYNYIINQINNNQIATYNNLKSIKIPNI